MFCKLLILHGRLGEVGEMPQSLKNTRPWKNPNHRSLTLAVRWRSRTATVREFSWACWPTKGDEDARSARTPACCVHTLVNACRGPKKVFAGVRTRHAGVRALQRDTLTLMQTILNRRQLLQAAVAASAIGAAAPAQEKKPM